MPSKVVSGKVVDSFRFLGPAAKLLAGSIPDRPQYDHIPWTPLRKPLSQCRFALVSTAALALKSDTPFDVERERRDPLWGDPTYRRIPADATERDIEVYHLHINPTYIRQDLNVALPVGRFRELVAAGEIGDLAPTCYSIMGYNTDPTEQVCTTAPRIAEEMLAEGVDAAFLVPV
jgi:D-proline reductase (dithiol) PrdB